jgi:hypothetical protein
MGVKGIQYRNQTQLHEWLTKQTLNFLADKVTQRGVIWRQEHTIHNGMRPDAVAFCSLQLHYESVFGLLQRPDVAQINSQDLMFVFESKVSYSDYKNSFNGSGEWKEQPYANFHFLVCPKDFSSTYDLSGLPDYWGILEPDPRALKIKRLPKYINIDRLFFLEAAYTILFKWGRTLNLLKLEQEMQSNDYF